MVNIIKKLALILMTWIILFIGVNSNVYAAWDGSTENETTKKGWAINTSLNFNSRSNTWLWWVSIWWPKAWTIPSISDQIIKSDKLVKKDVNTNTGVKWSILTVTIIPNIIKILFWFWSWLWVLALVYAWVTMMTSRWDSSRVEKWWKMFGLTLAWLIIMLLSRWAVWIIDSIEIWEKNWSYVSSANLDSDDLKNLPTWAIESKIIPQIIATLVKLVVLIIVIMTIYSWILYTVNVWEQDKSKEATNILLDLLTWLWVLLTAYVVVQTVMKVNF